MVSSSLSLWDLNHVSPTCGTVVETRFPVVPDLTTCLPLWGSADIVSLIAETESCILLRCSSALPLFFKNDSMLCTSSLSVRNPCINKLSLYTEPLVWDVLPLLCLVFHATSASFTVFFHMFVANPFCQHRILLMHDVFLPVASSSKNRVLLR